MISVNTPKQDDLYWYPDNRSSGLDKSFNARTFLQHSGLVRFIGCLPCSQSPLCSATPSVPKRVLVTKGPHTPTTPQQCNCCHPLPWAQSPAAAPTTANSAARSAGDSRVFPTTHPTTFSERQHQAELHPLSCSFDLKRIPRLGHALNFRLFSCVAVQFLPVEADCWIPTLLTSAWTGSPADRATPTTSGFTYNVLVVQAHTAMIKHSPLP